MIDYYNRRQKRKIFNHCTLSKHEHIILLFSDSCLRKFEGGYEEFVDYDLVLAIFNSVMSL